MSIAPTKYKKSPSAYDIERFLRRVKGLAQEEREQCIRAECKFAKRRSLSARRWNRPAARRYYQQLTELQQSESNVAELAEVGVVAGEPALADVNSGETSDPTCLTEQTEQSDEEEIQKLRKTITESGWRNSAEFIRNEIQFVTDLATAGHLSFFEIHTYALRTQVTLDTLMKVRDDRYEEECRDLMAAVQAFTEIWKSRFKTRLNSLPSREEKSWSLSGAMAWRDHVDGTLQFCESCCYSWRAHLDKFFKEQRDHPALVCIEEIERHLPILRSGRLVDVPAQCEAIEKCMILNAKLTVYAGDDESLRLYSNFIVGSAADESGAFKRKAAFSRAVVGRDLGGEEDWLQSVEPLHWLHVEARRLMSLYDNDGRLDSNENVIHERAYSDPLYQHTEEFRMLGTIDRYSLEVTQHPDVHTEIENLEEVFKTAGLNVGQRRALLLRRNGKIMSHKDLREWKRGQRAIGRNRSKLIDVITAATKKRVVKAPPISAGSYSGIVREGSAYALPLPNENKPAHCPPTPDENAPKWFRSTPPPISHTGRKTKHLFKKVST